MFIEDQPPLCYFPWGCLCAMHMKGTIEGKLIPMLVLLSGYRCNDNKSKKVADLACVN